MIEKSTRSAGVKYHRWETILTNEQREAVYNWLNECYGEPAMWLFVNPSMFEQMRALEDHPGFFFKTNPFAHNEWTLCISDKDIVTHYKLVWCGD